MTADRFEKLLGVASEADKKELALAHNGRITAMKAYNDRPGKETKADYDAARAMYDETLERLAARYFPDEAPAPEGERFKTRIQALNWLQKQGYKVSQGKFYQDCKSGFPSIHKDGSISRYQVMQYGQQLDVEKRSTGNPADLSAKKEELEIEKLRLEVEKRRIENRKEDANWLQKEDAWAQMAALVGTLRDALRHHLYVGQAHLIHLAGGDPTRGPEVYEGAEEILARAFNEVVQAGRIEGIFDVEEET